MEKTQKIPRHTTCPVCGATFETEANRIPTGYEWEDGEYSIFCPQCGTESGIPTEKWEP